MTEQATGKLHKCDNCGLPTRKAVYVTHQSMLVALRGKTICKTCLGKGYERLVLDTAGY